MNTPLVSILIPVYNRRLYIEQAVRSALAQTYPHIEVIVSDNASTDGTWEILEQLTKADSRVRIFRHPSNIGPVRNWLACAEKATGQYAKILWSDDLIAPQFIAMCAPYLANPDVGFVYSAARIFRGEVPDLAAKVFYNDIPTGRHSSSRFIHGALTGNRLPYSPGCALFRTDDLRANLWLQIPNSIGSDFSKHAIGNDFLLFLLTAHAYPEFATIAEPLAFFRDHRDSISTASGIGRLLLHYDIVRAYFSHAHQKDKALQAKLNAMLWMHLMRFDGEPYGLRHLEDFYPESSAYTGISISYFVEKTACRIRQAFQRLTRPRHTRAAASTTQR